MDVLLRNLDNMIVKKIDQEAGKKGLSRNELLKIWIEKKALGDVHMEQKNLYQEALDMNTRMMYEFVTIQKDLVNRIEQIGRVFEKVLALASKEGL